MALRNFRVYHKLSPPYSVLLEKKSKDGKRDETLLFESGAIAVLNADETEQVMKNYLKAMDAYGCLGVLPITIGDETLLYLVVVTNSSSIGKIGDAEIFRITNTNFISLRNCLQEDDKISEIRKLLNSGTFYFSWSPASSIQFDLSLCAQKATKATDTDNRFFWNRALHVLPKRYGVDVDNWLIKVMCGGVEMRTVYAANRSAKACLISRLSCERAGTRFNMRGVNDDGHVANFVETEQVIYLDDKISSFIQVRGSVPLFWEQPGFQMGSHKIRMSRGYEASAPAFDRHLNQLKELYGNQTLINLLGSKEGEHMLSQQYINHHKASPHHDDIPMESFDYHSECRGGNLKNLDKLKRRILPRIFEFSFFGCDGSRLEASQTGTGRTNCVDCLDRTNSVQSIIGLELVTKQLEYLDITSKQLVSRFQELYKQMWINNGDHISRIYAGTGALGGGRSKASDAARSASRTVQNNFLDGSKQEAIDILLLGSTLRGDITDKARALLTPTSLHASPSILRTMVERHYDYTYTEKLRVSVGTWNVNGGKHFRSIAHKHESITDWLLDLSKITSESRPELLRDNANYDRPVDIYAVGFQEIIDLNASNIMNASTTNQREWGKYLQDIISRDHKYVLLTSIQLVGVCLYIFIRPKHAPFIRDVGVDSVKTGLGGAAGNKGGVAIRFVMHHNSFVFVCSHLSSGQSHMQARNQEFHEIAQKLHFPMGRTISSHDYIIWCGDLNYRIDMPNSEVRELIKQAEYETLMVEDQLLKQKNLGSVFKGFLEFPTNFAPTYKYDLFCNDYDTSEKNRIPAWTDRILIRRKQWPKYIGEEQAEPNEGINQLLYNRAELKTSDHRPVLALYDIELIRVNSERRFEVYDEVISLQGPSDATVVVYYSDNAGMDDESFQNIIQVIGASGSIILVRFVEQSTLITFSSGKEALEAVKSDGLSIGGREMRVTLKTDDWRQRLQREMKLADIFDEPVTDETEEVTDEVPELNSSAVDRRSKFIKRLSLLREDSNFPTMSFDVDDEDEEALTGKAKSRDPSPRPEEAESRPTSLKKPDKPKPPERPAARPARPPPPAPARPAPPVTRPTSVQTRNHPTGSKLNLQANRISQPSDVVHRHASNPAEMKELINSLMSPTSPTSKNLPPPMQPQKSSPPTSEKSTPTTPPKPAPRSASSNSLNEKTAPAIPPRRDAPPVAAPRNSMSPEDSSNKTVPPIPSRPNAPPAVPPRNFQS